MRVFNDFENITMGDFVAFTEGYHVLTITGHKEDVRENKATGEKKDIDVFEVMSETGATTTLTLYYTENAYWTYKKLMAVCGAKVDTMKGNQNLNLDNLIGKKFGAFIELQAVEKWDETKGQMVTKRYPRVNMVKVYTEEKTRELASTYVAPVQQTTSAPAPEQTQSFGTPVIDDDLPF